MMLSLSQPDGDKVSSLSVSQTVHCIMHPHCDTSTHFIRTSTVSEFNDILCRFSKNTIANLHTSWIIYYTFEKDSGCLTPDIKCNRAVITQPSQFSTRVCSVKDAFPAVKLVPLPTFSDSTTGYMLTNQSTTVQADIVSNFKSSSNSFLFDWMLINFLALPLA